MNNKDFSNQIFVFSLLFSIWLVLVGYAAENEDGYWLWLVLLILSGVGMVFLYKKLYPLLWGLFIGSIAGMFGSEVISYQHFSLWHAMWVWSVIFGAYFLSMLFKTLGIRFK